MTETRLISDKRLRLYTKRQFQRDKKDEISAPNG